MRRILLALLLALSAESAVAAAEPNTERAFTALYEREWRWRLAEFPLLASSTGQAEVKAGLGEFNLRAQHRRLGYWQGIREQLAALPRAELGVDAQRHYDVYAAQLDELIGQIETRAYLLPINSDSSFYGDLLQLPDAQKLATPADYETYLARLANIPRYLEDHRELLAEGLRRGFTVQQVVLRGRERPLVELLAMAPEKTPFYRPFVDLPVGISTASATELRQRAKTLIAEQVLPAHRELLSFLRDRYIPGARKTLAASDLPGGKRYYQQQIRAFTTLDLDADRIHQIGLAEVARIREEMKLSQQAAGFTGSFDAYLVFLRSDPQFYAKTPRELLAAASYHAKRIDGRLPRYFARLPRQPYGVAPVPDAIAPYYTGGRYVPGQLDLGQSGTYWVNTHKLEARPLYVLPALTLHEAVPGHHLQGALSNEAAELPPFRRYSYISAYGEGWALYAEYLGKEMGIYETPYEDFGRLTYEMWRACRLVVDTGIHAKGWSRQRALDYMRANTALSEHEITTEIDRYISWPAQALSYKLGEIEIRKLRAEAEARLGEKFDLRAFHDAVLATGSVPLKVLRAAIEDWIATQAGNSP